MNFCVKKDPLKWRIMEKIDEDRNISAKLRELRRLRGLTVDTLAKKMGENSQKVGRIERGVRSLTFDYLVKVSKALDTPVESFLAEDHVKNSLQKSVSSTNILTEIVMLVEENYKNLCDDSHKKGLIISKIYDLVLRFPQEEQKKFLDSLFEFAIVLR